jgi:hypothetical protein
MSLLSQSKLFGNIASRTASPLTILGTGTALTFGVLLKRKFKTAAPAKDSHQIK